MQSFLWGMPFITSISAENIRKIPGNDLVRMRDFRLILIHEISFLGQTSPWKSPVEVIMDDERVIKLPQPMFSRIKRVSPALRKSPLLAINNFQLVECCC